MPRGKLLNGLVTQQKVLRAAVALFLEKGYTRTTTGEIAKAAGIGQSSFFHVFPSKEALLLELVQRMFSGQFALAGQHSGEQDPVLLYAAPRDPRRGAPRDARQRGSSRRPCLGK